MNEVDFRKRCRTCNVNKRVNDSIENGEAACCKWFLDNVICGDHLNTDECPEFEPLGDSDG